MNQSRVVLLSIAALALVLASCGAHPSACSASNCPGCCDASGVCETGNTRLACGENGGTCAVCSGAQICAAGTCGGSGTGGGQQNDDGGTGGGTEGDGGGTQASGGGSQSSGGGTQSSGGGHSGSGGGGLTGTGGGGHSGTGGGGLTGTGGGGHTGTGGGGSTSSCNSDTCSGCCTTGGVCLGGTTLSACGFGGTTCQTCFSNQICGDGACLTSGSGGGGSTGTGGGGSTGTGGGGAGGGFAGGPCTNTSLQCTDASGAGDYACIDPNTTSGFPSNAPTCTTDANCPTNYQCWMSGTVMACLQVCSAAP